MKIDAKISEVKSSSIDYKRKFNVCRQPDKDIEISFYLGTIL